MSKSLNLVKYQTDDGGNIFEEYSELVEYVFISPSLIKEIESTFPLIKRKVFEEKGSEERYEIECFDEKDNLKIYVKLEEIFIIILENECKEILGTSETSKSKSVGHIKKTDIQLSVDRFRTITNVINIFKLKNEKYENDSSAVLKIG